MITSLPRVVVDPTVCSNEPLDAPLVNLVQRLQSSPRSERDPLRHRRIWREYDLCRILPHDRGQLVDDLRAGAVVLDHDAAVLEVVYLKLIRNRTRVDAPRRDVRQVRSRGRWGGIVRLVRIAHGLYVKIALVGKLLARQIGLRAICKPADDHRDDDRGRDARAQRPALAPAPCAAASFAVVPGHSPLYPP